MFPMLWHPQSLDIFWGLMKKALSKVLEALHVQNCGRGHWHRGHGLRAAHRGDDGADGAQKILHSGICVNRLIGSPARQSHDRNTFCIFHIGNVHMLHPPEQVALRNRACVFAVQTQKRDTGKFPVLHFFESLAQSFILKYVSNFAFRC